MNPYGVMQLFYLPNTSGFQMSSPNVWVKWNDKCPLSKSSFLLTTGMSNPTLFMVENPDVTYIPLDL